LAADTSKQLRDRRSLDGRRVKARLIDALIIAVPMVAFALIVGELPDHWALVLLALEVTYFFVCEATWGYTVGKYLMGLRVIKPDGGAPGANSIAARNVIRVLEEPLLALLVMVGSGGRRQRLGDLVGTTAVGSVVYSEPPPPSSARFIYPALWISAAVAVGFLLVAPHNDYMRKLNAACARYEAQIASLPQDARFDRVVDLQRQMTAALAAVDAPRGDGDLRDEILSLKGQLDARAAQTWNEAAADPQPELAFRAAYARFNQARVPFVSRLYELGLTCRAEA
jgi:uncharacterized RDD family membrane protein YckC